MTTNELKDILAAKLKDEGTYLMWGNSTIIFKDSSKDYPMYETMLSLGYYIGTRF